VKEATQGGTLITSFSPLKIIFFLFMMQITS
jgi:hypothetical protein